MWFSKQPIQCNVWPLMSWQCMGRERRPKQCTVEGFQGRSIQNAWTWLWVTIPSKLYCKGITKTRIPPMHKQRFGGGYFHMQGLGFEWRSPASLWIIKTRISMHKQRLGGSHYQIQRLGGRRIRQQWTETRDTVSGSLLSKSFAYGIASNWWRVLDPHYPFKFTQQLINMPLAYLHVCKLAWIKGGDDLDG